MKIFLVLTISILSCLFIPSSSNINQIQLGGSLNQNTLNFTVENQATVSQALNYIVTQDDLVLLRNGNFTLPAGMIENVDVTISSSGVHTYTLTVTDSSTSESKSYSIHQ